MLVQFASNFGSLFPSLTFTDILRFKQNLKHYKFINPFFVQLYFNN